MLTPHVYGQEPSDAPHAPTITVNARLVVLDVVATGPDNKPIEGLTSKDFKIYEDRVPQSIRSFEAPEAHALPTATAAEGPGAVFDPASPASFGQSPVTVLVLDQLNTHFADSSFARRSMKEFLMKQPAVLAQPTTLLSVYENHFKQVQGFSRDRDLLLRAIDNAPTEYAWKLETFGNADYGPIERLDASLRVMEQIAQSFARIPGKKNLVWVGAGFPTLDPTMLDGDDDKEVKNTLQHVTDVLLSSRITLYAVDPTSSAVANTEITDQAQAEFVMAGGGISAGTFDSFNWYENFDALGPATGGRVVRGRNDVGNLIDSAVAAGAEFYTIGYAPTSVSEVAGRFRAIRVVCLRAGCTARTRTGYFPADTEAEKSNDTLAYDLATAAEATIPLNGLRVSVEVNHSVASPEESYIVHVGAAELTWKAEDDGKSTAHVAIMGAALNNKSKMIGHTLHAATAKARAGVDLRDSMRSANFDFEVKPVAKAVKLRFVVRDAATGRMGSFEMPLPGK